MQGFAAFCTDKALLIIQNWSVSYKLHGLAHIQFSKVFKLFPACIIAYSCIIVNLIEEIVTYCSSFLCAILATGNAHTKHSCSRIAHDGLDICTSHTFTSPGMVMMSEMPCTPCKADSSTPQPAHVARRASIDAPLEIASCGTARLILPFHILLRKVGFLLLQSLRTA